MLALARKPQPGNSSFLDEYLFSDGTGTVSFGQDDNKIDEHYDKVITAWNFTKGNNSMGWTGAKGCQVYEGGKYDIKDLADDCA